MISVRQEAELRKKEQKQDEENEQELLRQREQSEMQKVDELAREIAAVEKQCEAVERECAVLKVILACICSIQFNFIYLHKTCIQGLMKYTVTII